MSSHNASHRSAPGAVTARAVVVRRGSDRRGIVVRLLPPSAFSRAYGRQALVAFYGPRGRVFEQKIGVGNLRVLGRARRVPKTAIFQIPPSPDEVARHEKIRDIRREEQGQSYDPAASYNLHYEKPLPPTPERRVAPRKRSRRARRHRA